MRIRSTLVHAAVLLAASAGALSAQTETLLYDHIHITVPDPDAAAAWYFENFGGEYVDDRTDQVLFGTTRIIFAQGDERTPSAGGVIDHLGFSLADLDATLARVETAGATIVNPARDVPGLFRLAFIDDPWGVRLELLQDPQHLGFHHIHLRSPEPEQALAWYHERFGGVRVRLRGRLDGILYPGNVWLLVARGENFPSQGSRIDHLSWRAIDLRQKVEELRGKDVEIQMEPRDLDRPTGKLSIAFVGGLEGARIELVQREPDSR